MFDPSFNNLPHVLSSMQRSFLLFESAIKTEATRRMYLYHLKKFLEWAKIPDPDGLLQLKDSYLQSLLEDYLLYIRKRVSPNSIAAMFAPLELFFVMNDKQIQFKKIRKMFPSTVKKSGYGAWSNQDIRKFLENCKSKRMRALIHFLSSTGCRIGAVYDLRLRHLSGMALGCKSILFYEGSNEEYFGFLTPEASRALEDYFEQRQRDGENLNEDSPVFRNFYRIGKAKVKPMSYKALQSCVACLVKYAGANRHKIGTRFNIQLDHGFRKRFNTILKLNSNINPNITEKLMAHKRGLDGVYFKPTQEQCFEEFRKAILDLTVDPTERQKIKIEKLEEEKSELEKKTQEIQGLKKQFELDHDIVQVYARVFKRLGIELTNSDGTPYEIDTPEIDYCKKYGVLKAEPDPSLRDLVDFKDLQKIIDKKGCTKF